MTSNQENKPLNNLKSNVLKPGQSKVLTNNYGNVTNIAKILINANNTKLKTNIDTNKNSNATPQNNMGLNRNKTNMGQTRKNDLFF